ncbi:hypothetical protein LL946_03835 [Knoellia locipacati]|uniref:hypothetical protein n=1 Tax=Knoellia locipacati TaxID=882824 RepID=UPI00384DB823
MTQPPQGTPIEPTAQPTRFRVRQRVTMMVNRYEVHGVGPDGTEVGLWAFAEQKRMAFKEQVTFFADAGKSQPVFGFKARTRMDLGATYDVTDAAGQPIGEFRKDFGKSLLRSTWHLTIPGGRVALGQERNHTVAIVRRVWDFIPVVGDIPVPFLFHFDFTLPDGQVVMSSTKKPALRDVYEVELPPVDGHPIDWRIGAAMAVALDALQSR